MAQVTEIGIPLERKPGEKRVALVPEACAELIRAGHHVRIESGAGTASGFGDSAYARAGVEIIQKTEQLYAASQLIVKVKEPTEQEYAFFRNGHTLFSFLHLATLPGLVDFLKERQITAFAFETLDNGQGGLPILTPMSAIAGQVAVQYTATLLHSPAGGRGWLLGGAPGTERGRVVVLGAGTVGSYAARLASSLGARVDVFDLDLDRAQQLALHGPGQIAGLYPYREQVATKVQTADVVVGAVLSPGRRASTVVTRDWVAAMQPGAVIADVAVDQGGCIETTQPTDYNRPTYIEEGVVHFAVTNIPAAVPRTATLALSARILPYLSRMAQLPFERLEAALEEASDLRSALNVYRGQICHPGVASALQVPTEHGE